MQRSCTVVKRPRRESIHEREETVQFFFTAMADRSSLKGWRQRQGTGSWTWQEAGVGSLVGAQTKHPQRMKEAAWGRLQAMGIADSKIGFTCILHVQATTGQ